MIWRPVRSVIRVQAPLCCRAGSASIRQPSAVGCGLWAVGGLLPRSASLRLRLCDETARSKLRKGETYVLSQNLAINNNHP